MTDTPLQEDGRPHGQKCPKCGKPMQRSPKKPDLFRCMDCKKYFRIKTSPKTPVARPAKAAPPAQQPPDSSTDDISSFLSMLSDKEKEYIARPEDPVPARSEEEEDMGDEEAPSEEPQAESASSPAVAYEDENTIVYSDTPVSPEGQTVPEEEPEMPIEAELEPEIVKTETIPDAVTEREPAYEPEEKKLAPEAPEEPDDLEGESLESLAREMETEESPATVGPEMPAVGELATPEMDVLTSPFPAAEEQDVEVPAAIPETEEPEAPAVIPETEEPEAPATMPETEEPEASAVIPKPEEPEAPTVIPKPEEPEVPAVMPKPEAPAAMPKPEEPEAAKPPIEKKKPKMVVASPPEVKPQKGAKDDVAYDLSIDALLQDICISPNVIFQIQTHLKKGRHIIIYGPPGSGKYKLATEICRQICGVGIICEDEKKGDNWTVSNAGPQWTFADLLGAPIIKGGEDCVKRVPLLDGGNLMDAVKGSICSLEESGKPHYLILKNLHRIRDNDFLRELMDLLERGKEAPLMERGGEVMGIPDQFRIITLYDTYQRDLLFRLGTVAKKFAIIEMESPDPRAERVKIAQLVNERYIK